MSITNSGPGSVSINLGTQSNITQSGTGNTLNVYESSVVRWLSPPDPSSNHDSARRRREPGTCEWLLNDERYKRWKGSGGHLWLHGKPGCGKSVLCSSVIEDLECVYFYFTFSDERKQGYEDMLKSLVSQLGEPARSMLRQMMSQPPAVHKLEDVFIAAGEIVVVLDALDESPEAKGKRRELLGRLSKLLGRSRARLFATARHVPDIAEWMEDMQCVELSASPAQLSNDIQLFVDGRLSMDPTLRRYAPAVKTLIRQRVTDRADGMFRWACLLLEQMAGLKKRSPSEVEKALTEFPTDLDDVYYRELQGMQDQYEDVMKLLRWIAYARKPVSLAELVEVLIIDSQRDMVRYDDRGEPEDILRLLTSFVAVVAEGTDGEGSLHVSGGAARKVRLAHFTVQEYLESTRLLESGARRFFLDPRLGHLFITQSCVTYLMHYSNSDKTSTKQDFRTFPLLCYAAETWYHHALLHEQDPGSEMQLLTSKPAMRGWLSVHNPDWEWSDAFSVKYIDNDGTSLYYASTMGMKSAVELLLASGVDVDAKGGRYNNAAQAASVKGHIEILRLLLLAGPSLRSPGSDDTLRAAVEAGQLEIVKLLLRVGANPNAEPGIPGTALQAASGNGNIEIARLLLEAGADVDARGGYYCTALQTASLCGHIDVVRLLLDAGADVNIKGGERGTALCAASYRGRIDIVRLLLDSGADVNARGDRYCTALQAASYEGHRKLIGRYSMFYCDVLVRHGTFSVTPEAESMTDYDAVVRLLRDSGALPDTEDGQERQGEYTEAFDLMFSPQEMVRRLKVRADNVMRRRDL